MSPTRRDFLQGTAAALGAVAVSGSLRNAAAAPISTSATPRPMRLLVLGGTGFIGPYVVRHALYRGHTVSIFTRGRSKPHLFPEVEKLVGDRDGDIESLKGKEWDAVIDNTGYVPRHVRDSAELLKDSVGRYLFTSTGAVYDLSQEKIDEDSTLLTAEDPTSLAGRPTAGELREDVGRNYGPLKVLCEQTVREVYGSRATVVRLHRVAGPEDYSDLFTYWPVRIDHGGEVIGPGDPNHPVQYIDVRDVAEFFIRLVERDTPGTYNCAGPSVGEVSMAQLLYGCASVTATPVSFTWIEEDFLRKHEIYGGDSAHGGGYPLWFSPTGDERGARRISARRGVAAGLKHRPIAVTALDTLEWFNAQPEERRSQLELHLERDKKVLEAWHAERGN